MFNKKILLGLIVAILLLVSISAANAYDGYNKTLAKVPVSTINNIVGRNNHRT
jgi:hypothetical protein